MQTSLGLCRLHLQLARVVVASCRVGQDTLDEHARWLCERVLLQGIWPTPTMWLPSTLHADS